MCFSHIFIRTHLKNAVHYSFGDNEDWSLDSRPGSSSLLCTWYCVRDHAPVIDTHVTGQDY